MVTGADERLCPACGRPVDELALACEACGMFVSVRAAEAALQRALDAVEEETAQLAVARALVELPGLSSQRYVRDWLLKRIPMAHGASALVELLGRIDDPEARAEASRLAIENFREKKLPGRWEVALARLPTSEARRALLDALADRDDTARWTAAHAILELWEGVPDEALSVLRRVLKNRREHEEILDCAAGALARCDDVESRNEFLPRLLKTMRQLDGVDPDEFPPPTRAAVLLCGVADAGAQREAIQFLAERLPNGAEPILALALPPLLAESPDWLVAALVHACRSRHPRSPSAATLARAFGNLRVPRLQIEAWERLREALGDAPSSEEHPYRLTLVAALGYLGRAEAAPYLSQLLERSEDAAVREAARESLARLGDRDAIAFFVERLTAPAGADDVGRARWLREARRAAEVLAEVRDSTARPFCIDGLVRSLGEPALAREVASALLALAPPAVKPEGRSERASDREGPGAKKRRKRARAMGRGGETAMVETETRVAATPETRQPAGSPSSPRSPNPASSRPPTASGVWFAAEPPPDEAAAQREHRLVSLLEDVQQQVAALPHRYFSYERTSLPERAEKERTLRLMVRGSLRALMDALDLVLTTGSPPSLGPSAALAYYLQGRVYHALSCDPVGRDGHAGDRLYQQRLEHLNRAEECYRRALEATDVAMYRARTYFDLAVLLAESDRRAEAMTAFEAVMDLDVTGALGQTAEENLKRLQAGPATGRARGRARRGQARLPRALSRTMLGATAVVVLWAGWTQLVYPVDGQAALWEALGKPSWLRHLDPGREAALRPLGSVVVTARRLRVRSGRGPSHPVIRTARRGQRLTVIGEIGGWWKVRLSDDRIGWVARRYTGPLEEAGREG